MSPYVVTWIAIIVAAALAYGMKLLGHLVPERALEHPRVSRVAALVTIALLAALTAVQAFTAGSELVLDARIAALAAAAIALALRAPFIVVVVIAAAVAAGLRALGWG